MFANLHGLRIVAVRKAFQNKYTILVSRCEIILVLIGSSTRVLKFRSSGLLEIKGSYHNRTREREIYGDTYKTR